MYHRPYMDTASEMKGCCDPIDSIQHVEEYPRPLLRTRVGDQVDWSSGIPVSACFPMFGARKFALRRGTGPQNRATTL